jgi:probable HAF family extracellular repeat protein
VTSSRALADPSYTITNLGHNSLYGLNDAGEVVGNAGVFPDPNGPPVLYRSYGPSAGFTDLSGVLGRSASLLAINDSGQIAGTVSTPDGPRGFLDTGGQITLIPAYPGTSSSNVQGLSNSGAVVGGYGDHGYIYANGQLTDLGAGHSASAINDAGVATGLGAFLYQGGRMTSPVPGGVYGSAINAAGQVVGAYDPSAVSSGTSSSLHAFLYQGGHFLDLGTLGGNYSWARSINSLGQIVGGSWFDTNPQSLYHAFLYQNGSMVDLNRLIPASSGWSLKDAWQINDKGQILGTGIGPDGQTDSFLLTPASQPPPIPEPSTLAFFALAAAGVALRRAWRSR